MSYSYEHIIGTEEELYALREYISNNPLKWALDDENPRRTDKAQMKRYLRILSIEMPARTRLLRQRLRLSSPPELVRCRRV